MELCALGGTPAAFAGDQLIASIAERANDYRLDDAARGDRRGEFVERGLVEMTAWLIGMRRDVGGSQHGKAAREHTRLAGARRQDQRLLAPALAQQRAETAAETAPLGGTTRSADAWRGNSDDGIVAHAAFLLSGSLPISSRASAI
jgi:hypothetical protein